MRFEKYESYKDSGLEWLGDIPSEWEVKRFKEIALIKYSNVDKKSYDNQNDIFLCNYTDVYKNEFITKNIHFMKATASNEEVKKFIIKKNDVLFTKDSESFDDNVNPCLIKENFTNVLCGYHLAQVRADNKNLFGGFLFRLLQSIKYNYYFAVNSKGITRVGLGLSATKDAKLFLPPLKTQTKIANYLDTQTQKIDKEIKLLEEKSLKYKELKQTLINETVLRGLDKGVKLKDSGLDGIGDIPENWEVKRIKDVLKIFTGSTPSSTNQNYFNQDICWFTPSDFYKIPLINSKRKISKLAILENQAKLYTKNSVLLVSIGATLGKVSYTEDIIFSCNQQINILTPTKNIYYKYLFYFFYSISYTIKSYSVETTLAILNQNRLSFVPLLSPPLKEQQKIANYLDEKTQKIDNLTQAIQTKINLLKELRKTLINDVVIGKVKVI